MILVPTPGDVLIASLSAPDYQQIGELERLLPRADTRTEQEAGKDPITCFRCGVESLREEWYRNNRSCPFCGKYSLP